VKRLWGIYMVQRHYANRPNANRPNANQLNANFTISGPMPTVWIPTNPNANLKIELTTPNLPNLTSWHSAKWHSAGWHSVGWHSTMSPFTQSGILVSHTARTQNRINPTFSVRQIHAVRHKFTLMCRTVQIDLHGFEWIASSQKLCMYSISIFHVCPPPVLILKCSRWKESPFEMTIFDLSEKSFSSLHWGHQKNLQKIDTIPFRTFFNVHYSDLTC
jgi:hypothetical protein